MSKNNKFKKLNKSNSINNESDYTCKSSSGLDYPVPTSGLCYPVSSYSGTLPVNDLLNTLVDFIDIYTIQNELELYNVTKLAYVLKILIYNNDIVMNEKGVILYRRIIVERLKNTIIKLYNEINF